MKAPFSAMPPDAYCAFSTHTELDWKSCERRAISRSGDSARRAPFTSRIQPRTLTGSRLRSYTESLFSPPPHEANAKRANARSARRMAVSVPREIIAKPSP